MVERIVSGGQTGVDRAALDVALALQIPCDGWCPRGRRAEDGRLAERYPLRETPSAEYAQRTEWNVRDADGTLVVNRGPLMGGTAQTVEVAGHLKKPCLVVDLSAPLAPAAVYEWLAAHRIKVLNVAGPRESKSSGIYRDAAQFLRLLFAHPVKHTRSAG